MMMMQRKRKGVKKYIDHDDRLDDVDDFVNLTSL